MMESASAIKPIFAILGDAIKIDDYCSVIFWDSLFQGQRIGIMKCKALAQVCQREENPGLR